MTSGKTDKPKNKSKPGNRKEIFLWILLFALIAMSLHSYYLDLSAYKTMASSKAKKNTECSYSESRNHDKHLSIVKLEEKDTLAFRGITGVIKNTGKCTWSSINVEYEFFDKDNTFLFEDADYISSIKPNSEEDFSATVNYTNNCSNCELPKKKEYDHFKAKIVDAMIETD